MTSSGGGNTVKRRSSQQNAKQKTVKTEVFYTPSVVVERLPVKFDVLVLDMADHGRK